MQRKYIWMILCTAIIWLTVLFIGLFGSNVEMPTAGAEYGFSIQIQSAAAPVAYFAALTTIFIFLPAGERGTANMHKRYVWATASIIVMWLTVLVIGSLGLTFETRGTGTGLYQETVPWPLVIPVALFTMFISIAIAKFVANFGIRKLS